MLPDFFVGPRSLVREAMAGRAQRVFNMAGFAIYWAALGLTALPAPVIAPLSLVVGVVTALAFAGGWQLRQRSKALAPGTWGPDQVKRLQRGFGVIGIAEGIAVGLTVVICGPVAGHWEWLGPALALPIGLHFIPLARLFRVPVYYLTGVAICGVGLVTILFVPATARVSGQLSAFAAAPAPLWRLVPGLGAALVLWLTSAIMIAGGREILSRRS